MFWYARSEEIILELIIILFA